MREQMIEKKFTDAVKKMGGLAPKFVSPGLDGVPDRLVLLPMGRMAFVEFKAPGKKMRPLQIRRKKQLESLGFSVYCVDSVEQIGGVTRAGQEKSADDFLLQAKSRCGGCHLQTDFGYYDFHEIGGFSKNAGMHYK